MNTYELTTWIGDDLVDRERLDAIDEADARSFARGVATERLRYNPVAFAHHGVWFAVSPATEARPKRDQAGKIGTWYFVEGSSPPRVGWRR